MTVSATNSHPWLGGEQFTVSPQGTDVAGAPRPSPLRQATAAVSDVVAGGMNQMGRNILAARNAAPEQSDRTYLDHLFKLYSIAMAMAKAALNLFPSDRAGVAISGFSLAGSALRVADSVTRMVKTGKVDQSAHTGTALITAGLDAAQLIYKYKGDDETAQKCVNLSAAFNGFAAATESERATLKESAFNAWNSLFHPARALIGKSPEETPPILPLTRSEFVEVVQSADADRFQEFREKLQTMGDMLASLTEKQEITNDFVRAAQMATTTTPVGAQALTTGFQPPGRAGAMLTERAGPSVRVASRRHSG